MTKKKERKDSKPEPAKVKKVEKQAAGSGKEIRGIIRIAGKDVEGHVPMRRALSGIRGVGLRLGGILSDIAIQELKLGPTSVVGELSEEQITMLEGIITNPGKYGVPEYMLNRRKDFDTGENIHLIGNDLRFNVKQDLAREDELNTWRGYRHRYGQKVRGQHTRTSGRKGLTVGVIRKALKPGGPAAVKEGKEEPKKETKK